MGASGAEIPADHRGEPQGLGVRTRHLTPADRLLLVDDRLSTGAQVRALFTITTTLGAAPIGTAAIVAESFRPTCASAHC
jgi:adenine phosphoribosyltransferase